jgi:hypothetical protein
VDWQQISALAIVAVAAAGLALFAAQFLVWLF